MAWPPTSSATSFLVQGVTGVKIGVEGIVQTPIPTTPGLKYFTVLKVDQKTLADVMKLPNGFGQTSTRIELLDGCQWNLTVRDNTDTAMGAAVGALWTLIDTGGLVPAGTMNAVYAATIVDSDWQGSPKNAGERIIVLESMILIENNTATYSLYTGLFGAAQR